MGKILMGWGEKCQFLLMGRGAHSGEHMNARTGKRSPARRRTAALGRG
jgi:hypothetical protein